MKFTKIEIKDFQQFKDFELDLTYPVGHPKAGQPLEKVCFIGQSGTGKTTLLELLNSATSGNPNNYRLGNISEIIFTQIHNDFLFYTSFENRKLQNGGILNDPYKYVIKKDIEFNSVNELFDLIYFPANFIVNSENKFDVHNIKNPNLYLDFGFFDVNSIFDLIQADIQKYQELTLIYRNKLSLASETLDMNKIQQVVNEFKDWKKNNPSPIDDLADKCLDKILNRFALRVRREVSFEKKEDIGFVKIETFDGIEVPIALSSTGTKQILLTASPLFLLKPKNAIILFDEPENSLFPDIQRLIVDYYTSFTNDCQFFYATHSPIIASSFDPAERFILYFDETGKVKAKRGVAPKGDDSNDLLTKDFGLNTNLGIEGEIQFQEFISLKEKIRKETDNNEKAVLINKYMTIGKAYNFGYDLKVMEDEANYKKHQ